VCRYYLTTNNMLVVMGHVISCYDALLDPAAVPVHQPHSATVSVHVFIMAFFRLMRQLSCYDAWRAAPHARVATSLLVTVKCLTSLLSNAIVPTPRTKRFRYHQ